MGQKPQQAAVVPYRVRNRRIEVAAVTSTSSGDWILPKGGIEDGEQPWEAAAREAEEEAGVLGVVDPAPLGQCCSGNGNGGPIEVYLLRVTEVLDRWPEDDIRRRRWMSLSEAASCLRPEFRPFVAALERLPRARVAPESRASDRSRAGRADPSLHGARVRSVRWAQ